MPRQAKSTKVKLNAKAMQFIKDHENDPKSDKELIHCARNMRTVKETVWKDKARVVHRKKAGFVQPPRVRKLALDLDEVTNIDAQYEAARVATRRQEYDSRVHHVRPQARLPALTTHASAPLLGQHMPSPEIQVPLVEENFRTTMLKFLSNRSLENDRAEQKAEEFAAQAAAKPPVFVPNIGQSAMRVEEVIDEYERKKLREQEDRKNSQNFVPDRSFQARLRFGHWIQKHKTQVLDWVKSSHATATLFDEQHEMVPFDEVMTGLRGMGLRMSLADLALVFQVDPAQHGQLSMTVSQLKASFKRLRRDTINKVSRNILMTEIQKDGQARVKSNIKDAHRAVNLTPIHWDLLELNKGVNLGQTSADESMELFD
jgi:hypothetical protein